MSTKQHNAGKDNNGPLTNMPDQQLQHMLAEALRLHQSGNLNEADVLYRQILQADQDHSDALHLLGVIAYQKGEHTRAVELIEKALSLNPEIPSYHNNLGNALLNQGNIEKAAGCFREALRLKPDYADPYNNLGNAMRKAGNHKEALIQYMKALELDPDYVPAINNLANLLKDGGHLDDAIVYYRKAVLLRPDLADTFFNLGNALKESQMPDNALEQYYKALSINPDFAGAHNEIGNVLKRKGRYKESAEHYKKAISLGPDPAETYNNLADAYREMGKLSQAVESCKKALQLRPELVSAHVTMGTILLSQGNEDGALTHYQRALELDPDMSDAHYNSGLVLLMKGDLQEGWKEYEWRFKSSEIARHIGYRDPGIPLWDGSPLEGKTVLILSEQGAGDNIQFARYVPLVKARGGKVMFECPRELVRLFERFEGIDVLLEKPFRSEDVGPPDVCIHLLSLPGLFGTTVDTIPADVPYLTIRPESVNKWKSYFDADRYKVGLVWSGNPAHGNDRNRSCRLQDFLPLFSAEDINFFSLQKQGIGEREYRLLEDRDIPELGKEVIDYYDTAAILEHLDLVITVDTSVAHLAGALGKTVWTLLPFVPDWRWMLDRPDTPWYPSMRLFRQQAGGDWNQVIDMVASELTRQK